MDERERHFRLLTDTIEAVNSSLDLQEVLDLVATKVSNALEADACFVYLYDERADELVLRATHGTSVEEMTRRPRMRPGEGITGAAAWARAGDDPGAGPSRRALQELHEPARGRVRVDPRRPDPDAGRLEGALNIRTREPRAFTADEIELLLAIAAQVAQSIEHAKLYDAGAAAGARARGAGADLRGGLRVALPRGVARGDRQDDDGRAVHATGAALVLEDGKIAWPEGRAGKHAARLPLRWRRREIGELVCDRDTPFTDDEASCSSRSPTMPPSRSSTDAR